MLRNVDYIYGLVIYTGDETKVCTARAGTFVCVLRCGACVLAFARAQVRVKQSEVSTKRPTVETEINRFIIGLVCLQFTTCLVGAILYGVLGSGTIGNSWYMRGSIVSARSTCCCIVN